MNDNKQGASVSDGTGTDPQANADTSTKTVPASHLDPHRSASLRQWHEPGERAPAMREQAWVDCGWGRLIFGQTFASAERLVEELRAEAPGERDVAIYIHDPHVAVAVAPQHLFLDPSHTFRVALDARTAEDGATARVSADAKGLSSTDDPPPHEPDAFVYALEGVRVRRAETSDAPAIARIARQRGMVPLREGFLDEPRSIDDPTQVLVAVDEHDGEVLGCVTTVDHVAAFGDPEGGSSLWSLAVDPQARRPRVGASLVYAVLALQRASGRRWLDLSVMHDNDEAIALYRKLGFARVPVFCLKNKNPINEKLFIGPDRHSDLNIYARILVNEAQRRGIGVEVIDAEHGYFRLIHGGRAITCRESLTELTSAIAMSRCDDKRVTRNVLTSAGIEMPEQTVVHDPEADGDTIERFIARHPRVVVKPARGEQGRGVSVDLSERSAIDAAIEAARRYCDDVIVEEMAPGEDLRIVVIDQQVVAAAIRRPAQVTGNGRDTIRELIEVQSRRRMAATSGESRIPLDAETERYVLSQGHALDAVLDAGVTLTVRRAANLHTGGTIHDVTDRIHPELGRVAVAAARALDIPVVGVDLMVPDVEADEYVVIEANERPGLANHEPQPTAERFMDLLFPLTRAA